MQDISLDANAVELQGNYGTYVLRLKSVFCRNSLEFFGNFVSVLIFSGVPFFCFTLHTPKEGYWCHLQDVSC